MNDIIKAMDRTCPSIFAVGFGFFGFVKEIEGRVYGYVDDNVLLNDRPAQVYKDRFSIAKSKNFDAWQ